MICLLDELFFMPSTSTNGGINAIAKCFFILSFNDYVIVISKAFHCSHVEFTHQCRQFIYLATEFCCLETQFSCLVT